jgi:hypothetical protein
MVLYKKELHDFYRLPDTNIFNIVKSRRVNLWLRKGTYYLVFCDCCKLSEEKNICHKKMTKLYNAIFRSFGENQEKKFRLPYHFGVGLSRPLVGPKVGDI